MPRAKPGEVWIVDLGFAAKARPCLVLSDYCLGMIGVPVEVSGCGASRRAGARVPLIAERR